MNGQKKCSSNKHLDIDAIIYCQECNIFMCNRCANHHNEIFEQHKKYNLNENINDMFTGLCKEANHKDKLDFYCKNHNKLCCAACLSKIKDKGNGQHTDCNVCSIEEIKNEKENKLKENIKYLEEFSNGIDNSIKELKELFEKINKNKEELKSKILKTFTEIRNLLNQREDKIISEVDIKFENLYFKEELIRQSENIPNKIKKYLEKGKLIEKEWNENKNLNYLINDCINIENNVEDIKEINKNIEKCNSNIKEIIFIPKKVDEMNEILKEFGKIEEKESEILNFKFKPGKNYIINDNGLVVTKNNGGDKWNCSIIGNKEIPKNKISKWKIRLNNFIIKKNSWNILVGIGPDNPNNKDYFHKKCWSFVCGESIVNIKGSTKIYYNKESKPLKKGDIIEVIVDRQLGNLSFSINNINYGIAFSEIPKEDILFPFVSIYDQDQIVEIV